MARLLPSLELLRGFEAAARHGSFTRAGEELFLTQSAVSRQVLALEEHLGHPLFERRHRHIELTEAGRTLFRATTDAIRLLTDAAAEIQGGHGSVTVSCTMGFASLWLVPRLMDFRAECPGIDIRIAADNRIVDLDRERIELAVRYCPANLAPPGATRLFGEDVFPVCAPRLRGPRGHALATPDDLRHHVLLEQEHAEVDHPSGAWAMWFEAMGLQRIKPAATLRFAHYDQLVQAAIDGQGVALGIGPLVRRHIANKRLVAPFERRVATPRGYYLVTARASANRPEVAAFTGWLLRHASAETDASTARRPRRAR